MREKFRFLGSPSSRLVSFIAFPGVTAVRRDRNPYRLPPSLSTISSAFYTFLPLSEPICAAAAARMSTTSQPQTLEKSIRTLFDTQTMTTTGSPGNTFYVSFDSYQGTTPAPTGEEQTVMLDELLIKVFESSHTALPPLTTFTAQQKLQQAVLLDFVVPNRSDSTTTTRVAVSATASSKASSMLITSTMVSSIVASRSLTPPSFPPNSASSESKKIPTATSSPSPIAAPAKTGFSGQTSGAKAGIIVAAAVLSIIVLIMLLIIWKRHRRRREGDSSISMTSQLRQGQETDSVNARSRVERWLHTGKISGSGE